MAADGSVSITLGELRAASKHELEKGEAIVAHAETLEIADDTKRKTAAASAFAKVVSANPDGQDAALNEIEALLILVQNEAPTQGLARRQNHHDRRLSPARSVDPAPRAR